MNRFETYHEEVASALKAIGNPALGEALRQDRGSELEHLGIRFPALRARVKQGFSFCALADDEVLATWDQLWRESPYGDVLFAALEYYAPRVRSMPGRELWPVVCEWSERVDNWCHSDMLSDIYSRLLEAYPDEVLPHLRTWNASGDQWLRRLSLTSLVHYSGKGAVFLPPALVLPMVATVVDDHRKYVQLAAGWVLREMGHVYPREVDELMEADASRMGAVALSRAIERRSTEERTRLRAMRRVRGG